MNWVCFFYTIAFALDALRLERHLNQERDQTEKMRMTKQEWELLTPEQRRELRAFDARVQRSDRRYEKRNQSCGSIESLEKIAGHEMHGDKKKVNPID